MAQGDPFTGHMAIEQAGNRWDEHVTLRADLEVQSSCQVSVAGFQEFAFLLSWYDVILQEHKKG